MESSVIDPGLGHTPGRTGSEVHDKDTTGVTTVQCEVLSFQVSKNTYWFLTRSVRLFTDGQTGTRTSLSYSPSPEQLQTNKATRCTL